VDGIVRRAHRFLELGLHDPERGRYDRTPFGRGTVRAILDVACPTCRGEPGERCWDARRGRRWGVSCGTRIALAQAMEGRPARDAATAEHRSGQLSLPLGGR
jgi:hypothetical protein